MIEKDKEVLQIEEKYKDEFDALYDRIHVQVEQNIVKQAQLRKKRKQLGFRLSTIAVALVLVISLSIVLPIVLQQPEDTVLRYNDSNIAYEEVDYTLKDYIESLGENILYLDWYETAEEWITTRFYDSDNFETTVFIQEILYYEGNTVELSILKNDKNIIVETLESGWAESLPYNIDGIDIVYLTYPKSCKVKFEYAGYIYYLNFDTADWNFVTFTIESMLATAEM